MNFIHTSHIFFQLRLHQKNIGITNQYQIMDVTRLHIVIIQPTIQSIHSQLKDLHIIFTIGRSRRCLTSDRSYLHLIVISFLDKISPTCTTMLISRHIVDIFYRCVLSNIRILRVSHLPVINKIRSYRTCTPTLTEWECISIRLATTNTEVKSITITSSNTPTLVPVGCLVKLNSKHRLRISLIIILCPLQVLSLGIREVLYSIFIGISP